MADTHSLASATTAVVLTYGARTEAAVHAAAAAGRAGAGAVLIVLNGCLRETVMAIREQASALPIPTSVLVLPNNLGSAGGFAAGLEAAPLAGDRSFVWLLDDDNRPIPTALRDALALLLDAERRCGSGLVAVSCARPADRFHAELLAGRSPGEVFEAPGTFLHLDLRRRFRRARSGGALSRAVPTTLPAAPYGGLLLPSPLVRRIGLPRTELVLYEDDVEYTQRITAAGAALVFAPAALVHETDKSTSWTAPSRIRPRPLIRMLRTPAAEQYRLYYQYRNRVFLDRQRARDGARVAVVLNAAVYLGVVAVAVAADPRNRVAASTFACAVRDGLLGRLGRTRPLGGAPAHS